MQDVIQAPDQTEQDGLTYEVSDEALEATAGTDEARGSFYTLGGCTGLSSCPA
jgi:hypothetical protein